MSGLKPKEGLNLKSDFTNCTPDPPINQVSSHRTNMLLSVECQKGHTPTTIKSVLSKTDELLEDKHFKCQMSDKPLLHKSGNVSGVMCKGILARQNKVGSSIDWECDQTSENIISGLQLSTHDNTGLCGTESSSLSDCGPDMMGKLTSVASTIYHQHRKRKMQTSDTSEDFISFDSQASDELSKGELPKGSSEIKISNIRSLLTFGGVCRPETNQLKRSSTKSQDAVDEWEQGISDMELKPAISEQSNENEKMPDIDSKQSSSSLDNDFNWDPQKAFITFLWDNLDDQNQKKTTEVSAHIVRKYRASKDTDYANKLCVNFTQHNHTDPIFVKTQGKKLETTQINMRKYNKDNVKGAKKCIKGEREGTKQTSTGCELSVFKEEPLESRSNVELIVFPCTNCDVICEDRALLHSHMRQHGEPVNQVQTLSLICRECGWSFCDSAALLQHRSVHKDRNDLDDMGRDASLQHALRQLLMMSL